MLRREAIVYFGPESWDGLWRNRHQLLTRFAAENTVMYVEPRAFARLLVREWRSNGGGIRLLFRPLLTRSHGVWVFHSPLWAPVIGKRGVSRLTTWVWRLLLRRCMERTGMRNPILWISRPEMIEHLGHFGEKLRIYHVVDEYSEYYGLTPERKRALQDKEASLLKRVDLCIAVTENLCKEKAKHSPNVHLVPNAVDYCAFMRQREAPSELTGMTRPIIGYSGLISDRLDLSLLATLADRHRDWSITLVGERVADRCEEEMVQLEKRSNVHFLGTKTVRDLPAYLQAFDVGIIPYKTGRNAEHCSPLKMYEYMAAGVPIVATDFTAAREHAGIVRVALDEESFERSIREALAERDEERLRAGRALAARNTWDDRVREVSRLVQAGASPECRDG